MLYGAIFSENIQMYECAIEKAFRRMRITTDIYAEREQKIREYYQSNTEDPKHNSCEPLYTQENRVERLRQAAILCENNLEACPTTEINTAIENIKRSNNILKTVPCPLLY